MSAIIDNTSQFLSAPYAQDKDTKKMTGKGFAELLQPVATAKVASVETLTTGNEQKAFATHVLSYIDRTKVEATLTDLEKLTATNQIYGKKPGNISVAVESTHATANKTSGLPIQSLTPRSIPAAKTEEQSQSLAPSYLRSWYEKLKVSILGCEEKTLVVRDYFNKQEYSLGNFQKLDKSINKLIINGKEQ